MRVVTLGPREFESACLELARRSFAWKPDLLVGIRSGGLVVANAMLIGQSAAAMPLFPITRQRPSTEKKKGSPLLQAVLRTLPYFVTDALRIVEHRALTGRAAPVVAPVWEPDRLELEQLEHGLRLIQPTRILVIDDAVDTGATLRAVVDMLHVLAPAAEVRSAAIVQSTEKPVIAPDYVLHTQQLCRFPWSHDFKSSARPVV